MIYTSDGESYEDEFAHSAGISDQTSQKQPQTEAEKPVTAAPKTLYIIRHGATDMNNDTNTSADRIRGWKDVPLNGEGRQDAHKAGEKLAGMEPPTIMHHSDLDRAAETSDILKQHVDVENVPSRKLRPWDLGILTGKSTKEAIPEIKKYAEETPDKPVPKGESFNEFKQRAFEGIHSALDSGESPVAIVTHHRLERLLEAWDAKGQPADHSIDMNVFTQKGDPPGGIKTMDIKSMTHSNNNEERLPARVPPQGKEAEEPQRTFGAIGQHFINSAKSMTTDNLLKKYMTGKTSSESPEAGIEGLSTAFTLSTGAMPFAKKGAVGIFGGRLSPLSEVAAEGMEMRGKSPLQIKYTTGLERGAEGKWRKEISDFKSEVNLKREPLMEGEKPSWTSVGGPDKGPLVEGTYKLGDVYKHPEFFKDYPEAKDIPLIVQNAGKGNFHGMHRRYADGKSDIVLNSTTTEDPAKVIAHELQHYVQHKEGFSIGQAKDIVHDDVLEGYKARLLRKYKKEDIEKAFNNPDREEGMYHASKILNESDYLVYRGLAHEAEAHSVGDRLDYTPERARRSLGSDTEMIDREDQLVLDKKKGAYGLGIKQR